MVELLPRLGHGGVSALAESLMKSGEGRPSTARSGMSNHSDHVRFGASGGNINPDLADDVARALRHAAADCGFPDQKSQERRARFDNLGAIALGSDLRFRSGEFLRDDVWAFVTVVLCPDIVFWRFPKPSWDRFEGGARNVFQRLWIRGSVLDRGEEAAERWKLVEALTEDAMVQIFERASLGGNAALARAIAESWVIAAGKIGQSRMEDVMRTAVKLIRLRNQIVDLVSLDNESLEVEIRRAFIIAARDVIARQGEASTEQTGRRGREPPDIGAGHSILKRMAGAIFKS